MTTVGIMGAGAWGVALAMMTERSHKNVTLYAHTLEEYHALKNDRHCLRLKDIVLPGTIQVSHDIDSVAKCDVILMVVPAQTMRSALNALKPSIKSDSYLIMCSKGIELETGLFMGAVSEQILPHHSVSVFSGPTFAREVALGLPTIATLASPDLITSRWLISSLGNDTVRLYPSTDVIGLQVAGALKNVIAIAAGIATAQGLGENIRAALITRGLAEMMRLGGALGANDITFQGPAGIGDLILSATSPQSRNFSLGLKLGGRDDKDDKDVGLTEGAHTAYAVLSLAHSLDIDMPICQAVCNILDNKSTIAEEITNLWARPLKNDWI